MLHVLGSMWVLVLQWLIRIVVAFVGVKVAVVVVVADGGRSRSHYTALAVVAIGFQDRQAARHRKARSRKAQSDEHPVQSAHAVPPYRVVVHDEIKAQSQAARQSRQGFAVTHHGPSWWHVQAK